MITNGPQLIAYADRFGGSIAGLTQLLNGPLAGVFDGVHILPFFTPFDGVDAGFDPQDHARVDPRLGDWSDVSSLARSELIAADVIVNHMSAESSRFADVVARGDQSPWASMFLTLSSIFPNGVTEEDLARIYRPRPGLPFTAMKLGGVKRLVWTTFNPQQVDLDIRAAATWDYLTEVIDALTSAGVGLLRIDAAGYAGKEAGTDCFMTASTYAFMTRLADHIHSRGAKMLLEVHGHYRSQLELAAKMDYVYDFALPPLVIHALTTGDLAPLAAWLDCRPTNVVTVLDTHDGIGIIDAGPLDGQPGLLTPAQIDELVIGIHSRSRGSLQATGAAASNLDLYQVNCTFYDALGRDDARYLLARLIQLFLPGIPQVYYVGLLAGVNDLDLLAETGSGRDINRHRYEACEIEQALTLPVVRAQLAALRLRRDHPAFAGAFRSSFDGTVGDFTWAQGEEAVSLSFDAADTSFQVRVRQGGAWRVVLTQETLRGSA
ncbi:MAG: sucrose phosphorylase [Propionibacteriaceae bacterium]|jgi:sucrose phosphorylase|nr:sucrose phosphorylase [Propionibacteriaceae bacterium]